MPDHTLPGFFSLIAAVSSRMRGPKWPSVNARWRTLYTIRHTDFNQAMRKGPQRLSAIEVSRNDVRLKWRQHARTISDLETYPLCCAVLSKVLDQVLSHNNHHSYHLWDAQHMLGTKCFTYILSYVCIFCLLWLLWLLFTFCVSTSSRRASLIFLLCSKLPDKQVLNRALNPPKSPMT